MNILQLFIRAENVKIPFHATTTTTTTTTTKKTTTKSIINSPSSYAILYDIYGIGQVLGIQKIKVGRTDIVWSCSNPEYVGPILLPHDEREKEDDDNDDDDTASVMSNNSQASASSYQRKHRIAVEIVCCADSNAAKKLFSLSDDDDRDAHDDDGGTGFVLGSGGGKQHRRRHTTDGTTKYLSSPSSSFSSSSEEEDALHKGYSLGCAFFDVHEIWNSTGGRSSVVLPGTSTTVHVHIARDSAFLPLLPSPTPTSSTTTTTHKTPIQTKTTTLYTNTSPKLSLQIRGIKLTNTRNHYTLSRPNFYYEIHRKVRDTNGDTWALIYRSQRCMTTLNPLWPEVMLGLYPHFNCYLFLGSTNGGKKKEEEEEEEKKEEEEQMERFAHLDLRITIHDSSTSTASSFCTTGTDTNTTSPITTTTTAKTPKKKRFSVSSTAATTTITGSTLLGTITTTLSSLLSLSCDKQCNTSLTKTLDIRKSKHVGMISTETSQGKLVIVNAKIIKTRKKMNDNDTKNAIMMEEQVMMTTSKKNGRKVRGRHVKSSSLPATATVKLPVVTEQQQALFLHSSSAPPTTTTTAPFGTTATIIREDFVASSSSSVCSSHSTSSTVSPAAVFQKTPLQIYNPTTTTTTAREKRRITSFDEYIQNGSKLELCVAIDFTDNNGVDWSTPDNLHYIHSLNKEEEEEEEEEENGTISKGKNLNDYEFILTTIGSMISNFNGITTKNEEKTRTKNTLIDIPVWGFGAEFENVQYPIFQCGNSSKRPTQNNNDKYGDGDDDDDDDDENNLQKKKKKAIVNHLISTYHGTFDCFPRLGPANNNNGSSGSSGSGIVYDNVIRAAVSTANKRKKKCMEEDGNDYDSYTLLVVITTGSYKDVMRCKERLVDASLKAPLSIVFIHVGGEGGGGGGGTENGDWLLEGRGGGGGRRRSFLTFVQEKDWKVGSPPNHRDIKSLAKMAFRFVPDQVVEYFNLV